MNGSVNFQGEIPASKSMMNRALVIQDYFPEMQIHGDSDCDDVNHMRSSLRAFREGQEIHCGEAGTVIRFMGFRASRAIGAYLLTGSTRLLRRPQEEMADLLADLSVQCHLETEGLRIVSEGWKKPKRPLKVSRETSSQFASALILNSWHLPFDLEFEMNDGVSEGYLEMTLQMVREAGLQVHRQGSFWTIPSNQTLQIPALAMEPDYSSAFAVAGAAALAGTCTIRNASLESRQPDHQFVSILKKMNVPVSWSSLGLSVEKAPHLRPIEVDLKDSPDLFPVLAVVCAFASGVSRLGGAPHLTHKESNRIAKTAELLRGAGFHCETFPDGIQIHGNPEPNCQNDFEFDPDEDHRMAMAAGLLQLRGLSVRLLHPHVVSKSFPGFWRAIGVQS